VLSFVWPGLGQAYARHPRRATAFALPPAILLAVVAALALANPIGFGLQLLVPSIALAAIALLAIDAIWRVLAIVDAWLLARGGLKGGQPAVRDRSAVVVVLLAALMVGVHVMAGAWIQSFSSASQPIFGSGPDNPGNTPAPIDDIIGPGGGPPVVPLPLSGPIQVLFVGVDSGPGRDHALTDSLMVVSYERNGDRLAMVSVPRDTGRLPFYAGGTFGPRINSLMGRARRDPQSYPDGPISTLVNEISYVVGVPIQYYAVVDMAGFPAAVDLVGGVDVDVPYPIVDDKHKFYLDAGRQHLDGPTALLYARSRYGPNNNDWQRSRRQQDLLRALISKTKNPSVVVRAPEIMGSIAGMVRTNVPLNQLSEVLDLLAASNDANARHVVLKPNEYASRIPPAEVGGRYMTQLKMDAVAALSVELWGQESRYYQDAATQP
jgi:LCP family protein required for cell wall assembly